ncbi:methylmalonyl-CoA epimerase [Candidatus Zixiibacteriota bacterium]
MLKKISHIGLAVKNLDRAIEFYRDVLQMEIRERVKVADHGVEIAFIKIGGTAELELLAPLSEDSGVARFLAQHGPGIHHICYEVDDLAQRIAWLTDHGVAMIDERPRTGAAGDQIAFAHPKSMLGILTEFKEVK